MTNQAPVVQANIVYQTVNEDSPFSFQIPTGTFVDPDGDALSYSATLADVDPDTNAFLPLPSWLTMDASGQFHGTPSNDDVLNGPYYIRVLASDGNGGSTYDYFELTINNTPDAPIYDGGTIATQHATQSAPFSFQLATFHDVDPSSSLSYSSTLADGSALPSWLSFDPTTLTFSGTPSSADGGVKTVQVTAVDSTDPVGYSTSVSFTLDINHAPTSTGFAPLSFTEDSLGVFNVTTPFSDVDTGAALSYSVTKIDGTALPSWLSFTAINASTGTIADDVLRFSGTPFNSNVGNFDVKVTANDGRGGILSDNINVTVTNTNDAPVLFKTIPDTVALENDASFSYTVQPFFKDVDVGDTLTYTAENVDGTPLPAWLSFNASTGTFTGTPTLTIGGATESNIRIIATDTAGASTFDIFKIAIQHVNNPATGAVTIDGTVAEGNTLTANTSAVDDHDGVGTLHYQWQVNDGTSWVNVGSDSSSFVPTNAMAKANDTVQVITSFTDLRGGSESITSGAVGPVVLVNDTPTGSAIISNDTNAGRGVSTAQQNDVLSASNTLVDTDGMTGSVIDYQWLRNGVAIDGATDTTYALTQDDVGTAITVSATYIDNDNFSNSAVSSPTNNIVNTNDSPDLDNVLLDQHATAGTFFTYDVQAAPAPSFSDVDIAFGDKLTFTASLSAGRPLPAWLSINPDTGVLSGTPTNSRGGSYNVKVIATDKAGLSESDFMKLTVAPGTLVDHTPAGTVNVTGTTAELQQLTADASAVTDVDGLLGVTFHYQWQQSVDGTTWTAISGATSQVYTPDDTMANSNKSVRVNVSYTDRAGFNDSIASASIKLTDIQNTQVGTASADSLSGSAVIDFISGLASNDSINGGLGYDSLSGGDGDDVVIGGAGNDTVNGDAGNDALNGGDDNDFVYGGTGNDSIGGDNGNDTISGGDDNDSINGGDASDVVNGDNGNDSIIGGAGDDSCYGGAGDDIISATAGNDIVDGGADNDTISYSAATDAITVDLSKTVVQFISTSSGVDIITGIENVVGGNFGDLLNGDASNNILNGSLGNDTIIGGAGDDAMMGGAGVDTVDYSNSPDGIIVSLNKIIPQFISTFNGSDTITGTENLTASSFNDKLTGNASANDLIGGLGNDTLTGGAGIDRFIFNTATGSGNVDSITDFVSGTDVIGLSKSIFTAYSTAGVKVGLSANLTYDASTGAVAYDADGAGTNPATTLAILGTTTHPAALATDFLILS
ncbi:MAG: putative Ig domain-containing protein [Methylococcaceae bacterium]